MMVKYRVHEVAKDFNVSSREVIDFIKETTGAEKKHMTALNEDELNLVFEHFSKDKQVANFEEYLAGKLDVKAAEEKSGTKTKQSKEKATTSGKDKKATSDSESKAKKDETKRGNSKKISAADSSKKEGNKKVSNTSKEKSVKLENKNSVVTKKSAKPTENLQKEPKATQHKPQSNKTQNISKIKEIANINTYTHHGILAALSAKSYAVAKIIITSSLFDFDILYIKQKGMSIRPETDSIP